MRAAILDAAFPLAKQAGRGLAARYLAWDLARNGECEYPLDDADTLLASLPDPVPTTAFDPARLEELADQREIPGRHLSGAQP